MLLNLNSIGFSPARFVLSETLSEILILSDELDFLPRAQTWVFITTKKQQQPTTVMCTLVDGG